MTQKPYLEATTMKTKINFLDVLNQIHPQPLPYTKKTPLDKRREFIKHLYGQGYKFSEIIKVYPTTNYNEIRKAIGL